MIRDEEYILNLCDKVLGLTASRQHRFYFLRGDPGKRGIGVKLPVDGYYSSLQLVIEYRERQHTEAVGFFDKPSILTVSGVHRGAQRYRYDQKRRDFLPAYGITLVEFSYSDFTHDTRKHLKRNITIDEAIIRKKLASLLFSD